MRKLGKVENKSNNKFITKIIEEHNMDLPIEVIKNLPCVHIKGNDEILIENYRGIIEYTEEAIKLNTKLGIAKVYGKKLNLKQITSDFIIIDGFIEKFEYLT